MQKNCRLWYPIIVKRWQNSFNIWIWIAQKNRKNRLKLNRFFPFDSQPYFRYVYSNFFRFEKRQNEKQNTWQLIVITLYTSRAKKHSYSWLEKGGPVFIHHFLRGILLNIQFMKISMQNGDRHQRKYALIEDR